MPMRRLSWGAAVLAIAMTFGSAVVLDSPAGARPAEAAKKKHKRKKPVRCKRGQARVTAGRRTVCVKNSLPVVHARPQAVALSTALGFEVSRIRDRRGRR